MCQRVKGVPVGVGGGGILVPGLFIWAAVGTGLLSAIKNTPNTLILHNPEPTTVDQYLL